MLKAGQRAAGTWRAAVAAPTGPSGADLLAGVRAALADDLDTPRGAVPCGHWADAALAGGSANNPAAPALAAATVDALLGVRL